MQHPISIAASNSHWFEFAVGHQVSMVGFYILGGKCHMWTLSLWGLLRVLEVHDGHSGYEFPWVVFRLIPFGIDASYHDFHHSSNTGNYGSLMTIWDTLFDTNKTYF